MQALLQMQDIPSAVTAMQFYANVQPSIRYHDIKKCFWFGLCSKYIPPSWEHLVLLRTLCDRNHSLFLDSIFKWFKYLIVTYRGRNVYVQFSSHQELTTMDQNSQGRGDEVSYLYSVLCVVMFGVGNVKRIGLLITYLM